MVHEETATQIAFIRWARLASSTIPQLKWIFHVPNGEKRDKRTAGRLYAMGVKAGVWDLFWPCPRHGYAGVFIEFKSSAAAAKKNAGLTDGQLEMAEDLEGLFKFIVVDDWEAAKDFVLGWLGDDMPQIPSVSVH